jgi:biopolymer transport protein ExbD
MADSFQIMERLVRRRTRHLQFLERTGELNIVPYLDIMVNLIMFMLVTITTAIGLSVLGVSAPRYGQSEAGGPATPPKEELQLTVLISLKGHYVSVRGSYVGVDGKPLTKGAPRPETPTIPMKGTEYDYQALSELAAKIKLEAPQETRVILVGDYRIAYDTVVKTMDALREKDRKTLFPDVFLGTL